MTAVVTVAMTTGTTDGMTGGAITSEATTSGDRRASHPHLQQVQPCDHTAIQRLRTTRCPEWLGVMRRDKILLRLTARTNIFLFMYLYVFLGHTPRRWPARRVPLTGASL
jgi:hypothetical protein